MESITLPAFACNLAGQSGKWFAYRTDRHGDYGAVWCDGRARPIMFATMETAREYVERCGATVLHVTETTLAA